MGEGQVSSGYPVNIAELKLICNRLFQDGRAEHGTFRTTQEPV